ncbi:hypothetical protein F8388_022670 [Cannabis sativa]|uniref:RNase H type-1 domain-containing protein n=1 Tax=Cannabis sativa TaxID=3483 RepID=A0A7J6G1T1_CANSA|nr:hypothetical protein F8388_022670 [Cannabis sativa]
MLTISSLDLLLLYFELRNFLGTKFLIIFALIFDLLLLLFFSRVITPLGKTVSPSSMAEFSFFTLVLFRKPHFLSRLSSSSSGPSTKNSFSFIIRSFLTSETSISSSFEDFDTKQSFSDQIKLATQFTIDLNLTFIFEQGFKNQTELFPTYSRNKRRKADNVTPTTNFLVLKAKTTTKKTFKTAMSRVPPQTNSSSTRLSSRIIDSDSGSTKASSIDSTSSNSSDAEIFTSSQMGSPRTELFSEQESEFSLIGSKFAGKSVSTLFESLTLETTTTFLLSFFFFFLELECFFKRSRFLTKRSIREVGKPVSTTREPPRFGDWRSATIREIRVTLDFFHGSGMMRESGFSRVGIFTLTNNQDNRINIDHIEVDCKNLLKDLQSTDENLSNYGNIINAIRRMLFSLPTVTLHHTRRQGNTAAHNLAQISIGLDSTWCWNSQNPYPFSL